MFISGTNRVLTVFLKWNLLHKGVAGDSPDT